MVIDVSFVADYFFVLPLARRKALDIASFSSGLEITSTGFEGSFAFASTDLLWDFLKRLTFTSLTFFEDSGGFKFFNFVVPLVNILEMRDFYYPFRQKSNWMSS